MFETKEMMSGRMASLIACHVRAKGECTEDDLRQASFTDAEIERCRKLAVSLASVELNHTVNLSQGG